MCEKKYIKTTKGWASIIASEVFSSNLQGINERSRILPNVRLGFHQAMKFYLLNENVKANLSKLRM